MSLICPFCLRCIPILCPGKIHFPDFLVGCLLGEPMRENVGRLLGRKEGEVRVLLPLLSALICISFVVPADIRQSTGDPDPLNSLNSSSLALTIPSSPFPPYILTFVEVSCFCLSLGCLMVLFDCSALPTAL